MNTNPRTSTEADRRAFEALTNIRRLHNWRRELERLAREKLDRLSHALLTSGHALPCTVHQVSRAIRAGQAALVAGRSYDEAFDIAVNALVPPPCA
jgi:hypothetical protein